MTTSHRRPVLVAALTFGALLPAAGALAVPASAATISVDKACYINTNPGVGAPMTITGSGFVPGDAVDISGTGAAATPSATAAPDGTISATAQAPILSTKGPGSLKTTVTATDAENSTVAASTVVKSANLAVAANPLSVNNVRRDKVTFSFSGFTPGKPIYGYYARKRIVARTRFDRAAGPCGTLRQRALLFPGGHPHNDSYTVTFESVSHYSRRAFPRVTGRLSILHF